MINGVADKKIGFIGDSTTAGTLGGNYGQGIGTNYTVARLLTAAGYPSALGLSTAMVTPAAITDPRWATGSGWSKSASGGGTYYSAGGLNPFYIGAASASGLLTFTPYGGYSYDTFDMYYIAQPGGGTFQPYVDGVAVGASVSTDSGGGYAIGKETVGPFTAGNAHVFGIGWVSGGAVWIVGNAPYNSTAARFRLGNMGAPGSTTGGWTTTTSSAAGPLDYIAAYAADIWFIDLGINDAGGGVSVATYLANMLTIVNQCHAAKTAYTLVLGSGATGTFTLSCAGYTPTGAIPYNVSGATLLSTYFVPGVNCPTGTTAVGTSPTIVTITVPSSYTANNPLTANFSGLSGAVPILTPSVQAADVIIVSPVPSQSGYLTYLANELLYAAALPAFCAANNCLLLDKFNAWGGANAWANLSPAGYYGYLGGTNQIHPSAQGYADIGRLQAQALLGA